MLAPTPREQTGPWAKADDALQFVSAQEIADVWPEVERYLGKSRPFWTWLLGEWEARGYIRR